jgi:hypothetical protein
MKRWQIVWMEGNATYDWITRARDCEHAVRAWRREYPKLSVRFITIVRQA